MEEVRIFRHPPRMVPMGEVILRAQRAKFLHVTTPILKSINFPEQGNVWTTLCVLTNIANLMTVEEMSRPNIGTRPDIL